MSEDGAARPAKHRLAQEHDRDRGDQRRHQDRQHRGQTLAAEGHVGEHRQRVGMIGDDDGGAELAEGTQPGQEQPGADRAAAHRQADAQEDGQWPMAERGGDVLERGVDRGEGRSRGDDQERRRDEGFGEHDAGETVGQADHRRRVAQKEQQQDAAGQRRQGERKRHDDAQGGHPSAGRPRQEITERYAADRQQEARDRGACRRDADGASQPRRGGAGPVGTADFGEAGRERRREIEGEQSGEDRQQRRPTRHFGVASSARTGAGIAAASPLAVGGESSSPWLRMTARPCGPSRNDAKLAAPSGFGASRRIVTV